MEVDRKLSDLIGKKTGSILNIPDNAETINGQCGAGCGSQVLCCVFVFQERNQFTLDSLHICLNPNCYWVVHKSERSSDLVGAEKIHCQICNREVHLRKIAFFVPP